MANLQESNKESHRQVPKRTLEGWPGLQLHNLNPPNHTAVANSKETIYFQHVNYPQSSHSFWSSYTDDIYFTVPVTHTFPFVAQSCNNWQLQSYILHIPKTTDSIYASILKFWIFGQIFCLYSYIKKHSYQKQFKKLTFSILLPILSMPPIKGGTFWKRDRKQIKTSY